LQGQGIKVIARRLGIARNTVRRYLAGAAPGHQEHDMAIIDFNHSVERDPERAETYYWRGVAWHEKKEFDAAIDHFRRVKERGNGRFPTYVLGLAELDRLLARGAEGTVHEITQWSMLASTRPRVLGEIRILRNRKPRGRHLISESASSHRSGPPSASEVTVLRRLGP
jgi:tetratricopeptide (TPR) repeat protein